MFPRSPERIQLLLTHRGDAARSPWRGLLERWVEDQSSEFPGEIMKGITGTPQNESGFDGCRRGQRVKIGQDRSLLLKGS